MTLTESRQWSSLTDGDGSQSAPSVASARRHLASYERAAARELTRVADDPESGSAGATEGSAVGATITSTPDPSRCLDSAGGDGHYVGGANSIAHSGVAEASRSGPDERTPLMSDFNAASLARDPGLVNVSYNSSASSSGLSSYLDRFWGQILRAEPREDHGPASAGAGAPGEGEEEANDSTRKALSGLNTTKCLYATIISALIIIALLAERVPNVRGMNGQLQSEVDDILDLLRQEDDRVGRLSDGLSDITLKEAELAEESNRRNELDDELASEMNKLLRRVDGAEDELARVTAEEDDLVEQLARLGEENGHLEDEAAAFKAQIHEREDELSKLKTEKGELAEELARLEEENDQLKEKVAVAEAKNDSLKAEIRPTPAPSEVPGRRRWRWNFP